MSHPSIAKIRRLVRLPAALLALVVGGCGAGEASSRSARSAYRATDSMGVVPRDARAIPVRGRPELAEGSGAAMSLEQPGVIFTMNDSGSDPLLFALDTTGVDRGVWRLAEASNKDWEAISIGPCGAPEPPTSAPSPGGCVYVGDVGDNSADRGTRAIYRVEEPRAREAGFVGELPAARLTYTYEDSPHDVEAMYVGRDGTVYLITKRRLRDAAGRSRRALVFTLPPDAWDTGSPAVARLVDSLPIVPGSAPLRNISDASLSPDSRYLAVRTYGQVYVFATDSATGRVVDSVAPAVCNIAGLGEPQGEGMTWYGSSGMLLLTSEGRHSPFLVVSCPLPAE